MAPSIGKYEKKLSAKTRALNKARLALCHPVIERWLTKRICAAPGQPFWGKLVPPEYLYPSPSWRDYDRNGLKMRLDISKVVDHLRYFGFAEPGLTRFVSI